MLWKNLIQVDNFDHLLNIDNYHPHHEMMFHLIHLHHQYGANVGGSDGRF